MCSQKRDISVTLPRFRNITEEKMVEMEELEEGVEGYETLSSGLDTAIALLNSQQL